MPLGPCRRLDALDPALRPDRRGRVVVAVVERSADSRLEPLAPESVKSWQFDPGELDGQAVRARMRVALTFNPGWTGDD